MTRHGKPLCGAKTKSGGSCRAYALENGRCRFHGGNAPKGMAHYNYRHGKRSKAVREFLPQVYQKFHDSIAEQDELQSLKDDLKILDTRMFKLMQDMSGGVSGELWEQAQRALREFDRAARAADDGSATRMARALDELRMALQAPVDSSLWREIRQLIQERKSILSTMSNIEYNKKTALSAGEARQWGRMVLNANLAAINEFDIRELDAFDNLFSSIGFTKRTSDDSWNLLESAIVDLNDAIRKTIKGNVQKEFSTLARIGRDE